MVRVRIFWMPKDGHTTSEYEDAYATSDPGRLPFRAAVADGATESAFSGSWARRLTGAFTNTGDLASVLPDLRDGFHRISTRGHVPWYLEEKTQEGAHAAFVGLQLDKGENGSGVWASQAVGDCCLLHIRGEERLLAWPISDPRAFSMTPDLVSSRESDHEQDVPQRSGAWEAGDRFVLATDALAAWLLEHGAADAAAEGFDEIVERARQEGAIRNDDVTAVVIDV